MPDFIESVLGNAASTVQNGVAQVFDTAISQIPGASTRQSRNANLLKPEYACTITCSELGIYVRAALPPDFDWSSSASYDTPMKDLLSDAVASLGTIGSIAQTAARATGNSLVTQALTAKMWNGSESGAITLPLILQAETDEVEEVLKPLIGLMSLTLPRLKGGRKGSILQAPGPAFDIAKAYNKARSDASGSNSGSKEVAGVGTVQTGLSGLYGSLKSGVSSVASNAFNGNYSDALSTVQGGLEGAAAYADDFIRSSTRNVISIQIGNYLRFASVVIEDVQQKHYVQPVGSALGTSTGNMQRVEVSITFRMHVDPVQDDLADIFLDPRARSYVQELLSKANGTQQPNFNHIQGSGR